MITTITMQTMETTTAMIITTTNITARHTMMKMTITITTTQSLSEIRKEMLKNTRVLQRNQIYLRDIRTCRVGQGINDHIP